jgi:ABC-type sugar transport system substrate-binding protein
VIVFSLGNCGAAPYGRALDARANTPEGAVVAETPTLPYVARTSGPGKVTISLDAMRLPVGAFPGRDMDWAHDAIAALYPEAALPAANALADAGIKRGDRVAIVGAQSDRVMLSHLATWKLGAISVPLSVLYGPDGLQYRLADCERRRCSSTPSSSRRLKRPSRISTASTP